MWRRLDPAVMLVALALTGLGLVMIYSATERSTGLDSPLGRQSVAAVLGLALVLVALLVDYEMFGRFWAALYALSATSLVAVMFLGTSAKGAQRWLELGPLGSFQPSEPAKLVVLLSAAWLLSRPGERRWLTWVQALMAALAITLLTAIQPDLGTAVVFILLVVTQLFIAGVPKALLLGLVACGAAVAPFVLRDYQRERLLLFLHPESDPTGAGWNLLQSQIAVGAGKIWGRGLFQGTQHSLKFLPERHTDFIFAVIGEELGLVGTLAILALFGYLLAFCLRVAATARDPFGAYLAVGIFAYFLVHLVVNVGMVVGLMPITGLPLPFLSYGGSALITNFAAIGLLLGVYVRRRSRPVEPWVKVNPEAVRIPRPRSHASF